MLETLGGREGACWTRVVRQSTSLRSWHLRWERGSLPCGDQPGSCSATKWQESSLKRLKQARNALCVSHISNMEVSNPDLRMQLGDPQDPDFFCVLALPSIALGCFYLVALHFSNLMLQNGSPSLSCHICPTACLTKEALKGDVLSQFQVFSWKST